MLLVVRFNLIGKGACATYGTCRVFCVHTVLDRHSLTQIPITYNLRRAVDSDYFISVRHQEHEPDSSCLEDVLETVETVIARAVRHSKRLRVNDFGEPWWIPFRRDVEPTGTINGRHH